MSAIRILVDADACPVKTEIIKVAERYRIAVIFVANGGLRPSRHPLISNITVAAGADIADDWIAEEAKSTDIAITADIPLAARLLEKGAIALNPNGKSFTSESIGMALAMRDLKQHLRETTQGQTCNASFTQRARSDFLQALDREIMKLKKIL